MAKKKNPIVILEDTREQRPLDFAPYAADVIVEKATLWPGDYTIKGFERSIAFERKSVSDLIGTMTGGYVGKDSIRRYESRFDLELEEFERHYDRAFVVVEPDEPATLRENARYGANVEGVEAFVGMGAAEQIDRKLYRAAIPPTTVWAFIRALIVDYGCHVYLAMSREDAAHEIVEIAKRYTNARRHIIHRGKVAAEERIREEKENETGKDPW